MSVQWRYPLCKSPLRLQARSYHCDNNHCYDLAKESYCHLLPVQHKRSKMPGDNQLMIKARQRFLASGSYDHMAKVVAEQLLSTKPSAVLDLGCGEAYYLRYCRDFLQQQGLSDLIWRGIDISKDGIKAAAKADKQQFGASQYAVASTYNIPLMDDSFDAAIRIFAPSDMAEVHRVLKPSGYFICVSPGPTHLLALKELLYDEPKLHTDTVEVLEGFVHQQRISVAGTLDFSDAGLLEDLLTMTPFAWQVPEQRRVDASRVPLTLTSDFLLDVYQCV